jgi:hypothetical protein
MQKRYEESLMTYVIIILISIMTKNGRSMVEFDTGGSSESSRPKLAVLEDSV